MYKITIAYDGTNYSGWQVQPANVTIQELLQRAAETLLGQKTQITGSGRTDAGVHALRQIAHFPADQEIDLAGFLRSINGILPPEIRVKAIERVADDFHARYSAIGKVYHYHLTLGPIDDPFRMRHALHFPYRVDWEALEHAAKQCVGTHDFTSFANLRAANTPVDDAIRTISRLDLVEEENGLRMEFEGNGFLYKMVRNIVGTLLEIAGGKRPADDIPRILKAKDRKAAGHAAPPHGLFLVKVRY